MTTVYSIKLSGYYEKVNINKKVFLSSSLEAKCIIISEILHFFQCGASMPNLKIMGCKEFGRLTINSNISAMEDLYMITQSITGVYEKKINLKKI